MGRRNHKSKPIKFLHGSSVSFSQWNRASNRPFLQAALELIWFWSTRITSPARGGNLSVIFGRWGMVSWTSISPKHCIAMQALPKTWCMLKIHPLGNPWHLLLSVQASKCCELPVQQRCINHHLGITKNSNKKELIVPKAWPRIWWSTSVTFCYSP